MCSQVYDVFLSFRGEDTRYNFVSHLHEAFVRAKIKLFIDYELLKGEEITPALIEKIEAAKISVIIFSADYASSTFCLDELARILECRRNKKQTVLPIFYKVDPSDIRKLKNKYAEAFSKHEARFTEMDKIERWKSALHEASNLSGWSIDDKSDEAKSIGEIIGQISVILTWKSTKDAPDGTPGGGGLLVVIIHEAEDVEGKYHTNPYARLVFRGEERRTKYVKKNRYPRWEEEFYFMVEEAPTQERILVEVISASSRIGLLHPQETLGFVDINLGDVVSRKTINEKYQLIDSRRGRIQVELQWRTAL